MHKTNDEKNTVTIKSERRGRGEKHTEAIKVALNDFLFEKNIN